MFPQGHRPDDSHSISSQTSNATSRATTLSDAFVRPKVNGVSKESSTIAALVNRSISPNPPEKTLDYNTSNGSVASGQKVQQLIPGSILINDRGEIFDRTAKANGNLDSPPASGSIGSEATAPNTKIGGYLAPTHIQRQTVASPGMNVNTENPLNYPRSESTSDANTPGRIPFNRQQTFPGTQDKNLQAWVNPYWSNSTPAKPPPSTPWVNPYWGAKPPGPTPAENPPGTPWVNPYWGTKPVGAPATSATVAESAPTQPKKKKTTVLDHAWEDQQTAVFTFDFLPTPSFYVRIYPLNVTAYASDVPNSAQHEDHPNPLRPPSSATQNLMTNYPVQPAPPTNAAATSLLPSVSKQVETNPLAPMGPGGGAAATSFSPTVSKQVETNPLAPMSRSPLPMIPGGAAQPSRFDLGQIYPSSAPTFVLPATTSLDPNPRPGHVDLEAVIANRFPRHIPLFTPSLSASQSRLILYPLQKVGSVVLI